tara:strand:+ start:3712 stop:4995 length:1284 start_codon:yes stop_codon:yes gene_type:complete
MYSKDYQFERIIFWLSELYYSGFIDLIWSTFICIYYDYYYITYPYFEKIIIKKNKDYTSTNDEKQKIIILISLFKNLYSKHIEKYDDYNCNYYDRHIVRIISRNKDEKTQELKEWYSVFKGRKSKLVQNYCDDNELSQKVNREKELIKFIQSIDKNQKKHIYLMYSLYYDENKDYKIWLFDKLLKFYISICDVESDKYISRKRKVFEICDDKDVLLSIFIALINDIIVIMENKKKKNKQTNTNINTQQKRKNIFTLCTNKEVEYFIETNNTQNIQTWDILREKQKYKICDEISVFYLQRDIFEDDEMKDNIYYKWEYFTKQCPLWEYRVKKHKGYYDLKRETIRFKEDIYIDGYEDDVNQQEFYDLYGLEPDEQPIKNLNNILLIESIDDSNLIYYKLLEWFQENDINKDLEKIECDICQLHSFMSI